MSAWSKWKSLPSIDEIEKRDSSDAIGIILTNLLNKRIKGCFDELKEVWYEINDIKKQALRDMIYMTTSRQQRMFDRWREHAKEMTSMIKAKKTVKFFEVLNQKLHSNVSFITEPDRDLPQKVATIKQLMLIRQEK